MIKTIVIGSVGDAKIFAPAEPYAMISFVNSMQFGYRRAPRILRPPHFRGRIVVPADDVEYCTERTSALSERQAQRLARFVVRSAPHLSTLVIHCRQGVSRSPGAAIANARAYSLPWEQFVVEPLWPNPHVTDLLGTALGKEMHPG